MSEILIPVANVALSNLNTEGEARLNALESKSNKITVVNTISPSDAKYPSESALVNYIGISGGKIAFDYSNPIAFAFGSPAPVDGWLLIANVGAAAISGQTILYIDGRFVGTIGGNGNWYNHGVDWIGAVVKTGQIPTMQYNQYAPNFQCIYPFLTT